MCFHGIKETGRNRHPKGGFWRCAAARVFVALKMTPEIAGELAQMAQELERFPVRLIAPTDIHLTLVPPWNEVSIPEAIDKLRGVADRFGAFTLEFRHVGYGPEPRRPRLLWAECAAGLELTQLRAELLVTFGQADQRPFRPHVTLARLRGNGAVIARNHPVDRDLALAQRVGSVELMQSPAPGESGYKVSCVTVSWRQAGIFSAQVKLSGAGG